MQWCFGVIVTLHVVCKENHTSEPQAASGVLALITHFDQLTLRALITHFEQPTPQLLNQEGLRSGEASV